MRCWRPWLEGALARLRRTQASPCRDTGVPVAALSTSLSLLKVL